MQSPSSKNIRPSPKRFQFHLTKQLQNKPVSRGYSDYFQQTLTPTSMHKQTPSGIKVKTTKIENFNIAYQTFFPSGAVNCRSRTEESLFEETQDRLKRLKELYSPEQQPQRVRQSRSVRSIKKGDQLLPILERVKMLLQRYSEREEQHRRREELMAKEIEALKAKLSLYEQRQKSEYKRLSFQQIKRH